MGGDLGVKINLDHPASFSFMFVRQMFVSIGFQNKFRLAYLLKCCQIYHETGHMAHESWPMRGEVIDEPQLNLLLRFLRISPTGAEPIESRKHENRKTRNLDRINRISLIIDSRIA